MRVEVCIYRANDEKDGQRKISFINEALDKMLEVKLSVRILHDSKQLSLKKYAILCDYMVTAEKNLNNWRKYNLNNIKNEKTISN